MFPVEKQRLPQDSLLPGSPRRWRKQTMSRRSSVQLAALFSFVCFSIWHIFGQASTASPRRLPIQQQRQQDATAPWRTEEKSEWKVPLEAHIMSKCPDALDCLEDLLVPTMEIAYSKVNLTLSYIGTPTDHPEEGVDCKHGPSECLGNIIELCAAELYPDPKIYVGFTLCLTRRYPEIAAKDLVQDCALQSGMDFGKLNDCASKDDGAHGMGLLRDSVQRSLDVGAGISCTIRLNETVRCIRDGGEWKNCKGGSDVKSLVADIEQAWAQGNGRGEGPPA